MINNIIEDNEYKNIVTGQIKDVISFILDKNIEFAITANISAIEFNPELPDSIHSKLSKFSLFVLSNYTYSTVKIENDTISFEAGFGAEGFGSVVTIPLHAVFQIIVEESILYVNSVATVETFNTKNEEKSKNVFKNNPNNKKLMHD